MAFKGQPVATTTHKVPRAKVSDGKSVQVEVPASTNVETQKFYELGGFFGAATESVSTGSGETDEVVLTIEQAEYETDQINESDNFDAGDEVYFDGKQLTTQADDGSGSDPVKYRRVGRVSVAKDANNIIWFILGSQ